MERPHLPGCSRRHTRRQYCSTYVPPQPPSEPSLESGGLENRSQLKNELRFRIDYWLYSKPGCAAFVLGLPLLIWILEGANWSVPGLGIFVGWLAMAATIWSVNRYLLPPAVYVRDKELMVWRGREITRIRYPSIDAVDLDGRSVSIHYTRKAWLRRSSHSVAVRSDRSTELVAAIRGALSRTLGSA